MPVTLPIGRLTLETSRAVIGSLPLIDCTRWVVGDDQLSAGINGAEANANHQMFL